MSLEQGGELMFLFKLLGYLLYGEDYEKLSAQANKKRPRRRRR